MRISKKGGGCFAADNPKIRFFENQDENDLRIASKAVPIASKAVPKRQGVVEHHEKIWAACHRIFSQYINMGGCRRKTWVCHPPPFFEILKCQKNRENCENQKS